MLNTSFPLKNMFPQHLWLLLSDFRGRAKWFGAHYNHKARFSSAVKCKKGPQVLTSLPHQRRNYIIIIIINSSYFRIAKSILRVLGEDCLRGFPPLDWSFLDSGLSSSECQRPIARLCALQGPKSPSAAEIMKKLLTTINVDEVSILVWIHKYIIFVFFDTWVTLGESCKTSVLHSVTDLSLSYDVGNFKWLQILWRHFVFGLLIAQSYKFFFMMLLPCIWVSWNDRLLYL